MGKVKAVSEEVRKKTGKHTLWDSSVADPGSHVSKYQTVSQLKLLWVKFEQGQSD